MKKIILSLLIFSILLIGGYLFYDFKINKAEKENLKTSSIWKDFEAKRKKEYSKTFRPKDLNPKSFITIFKKRYNKTPINIVTMDGDFPENWVKPNDIPYLISIMRSKEKCCAYMHTYSSFLSPEDAEVGGFAIIFLNSYISKTKINLGLNSYPKTDEESIRKIEKWYQTTANNNYSHFMKQFYKSIAILLFIISFKSYSQTQEAIIYFKDGDSIEGFAALKFNKIKFKISPDDKTDTWDYEYVKKITFIGFEMRRTFEYVTLNSLDKPKLVETITKGQVSLYKKLGSDYSLFDLISNPHDELPSNNPNINSQLNSQFPGQYSQAREVPEFYYIKKEKDKYPTCLNCGVINAWRKNTSKFFADCDFIVKKLKGDKWVFTDIKEIVEFYNDVCLEE